MTMAADARNDVEAPAAETAEAKPKPSRKRLIVFGVLGVAMLGGAARWISVRGLESTDDAQVDAEVVALAPRVSGVVVKVAFEDNQRVKAGDVLAELDDAPAKAKLAQAEASLAAAMAAADAADADARLTDTSANTNKSVAAASLGAASAGAFASREQIGEAEARVASAKASLAQAKSDRDRTTKLVESGALSAVQLEQSRTSFDTATASLAQAEASLATLRGASAQAASRVAEASAKNEQAKQVDVVVSQSIARAKAAHAQVDQLKATRDLAALDLSYTKVVAPRDGYVSKKNVGVGQTLNAGAPIVQLVPADRVWITANFKETQIGKMAVGQSVEVSVDAFSGAKLRGEVESFSGATGSRFALLPPDNASGNFTKVVQRVPVRIKLVDVPQSITLRPGMNAELTVDTRR